MKPAKLAPGTHTPYNVTLGTRLKAVMDARDLRNEDVASALGVSWQTIHKTKLGQGIRSETLPRLAVFLGVSLDYLFGLTDTSRPWLSLAGWDTETPQEGAPCPGHG